MGHIWARPYTCGRYCLRYSLEGNKVVASGYEYTIATFRLTYTFSIDDTTFLQVIVHSS